MEVVPLGPGFAAELRGVDLIDVASSDLAYHTNGLKSRSAPISGWRLNGSGLAHASSRSKRHNTRRRWPRKFPRLDGLKCCFEGIPRCFRRGSVWCVRRQLQQNDIFWRSQLR